jgi:sulfur carrier protein
MRVNAEQTTLQETTTLEGYLLAQGFDPRTVAVERNGRIVPRADFARVVLGQDDELEILRFVGGG